ncbi:myoferlin-like isoform X2 [Dendronephthya gigantea]|nr:myoferlin-like isoform X2 [Dendronephthya gigantea]
MLCTKWEKPLKISLGKEELQRGDVIKVKIYQQTGRWSRDSLLGKAELPVEDLINKKRTKIPYKVNLRDGDNHPTEAICKCTMENICPGAVVKDDTNQISATVETSNVVYGEQPLPQATGRSQFAAMGIHRKISFPEKQRDFQIRIKVDEGRHIFGRDINPVVRVTVGGVKKQTKVKHTTNQPYYNQTFSFNFHTNFHELFEQSIRFEVFDSRRLRSKSLIGYYKCDVREVYNFEGHIVLRKWIVLAEPRENERIMQGDSVMKKNVQPQGTDGHAVGFLKVSMCVLEAGMSAPSLENLQGSPDQDDIESNLLQFPGVSLSPAVFTLKVYKAVDIPQMDHENLLNRLRRKKKDCADPYCIFSFAGMQAKSSIKYDSRSPLFNEQLNISFKYPSVCDKLKIQLLDSDVGTADDYIGTIYLPVSHISGMEGNEFLPTFGPCFVNMYGSPREYSDWPNKHEDLDKGIGEGAAYRGRVLVELQTKLDVSNGLKVEPISSFDMVRARPYMGTKKFRLLAVFLEATMLAVEDSQVEFEMSIGNYGNKLDDSVSPRPSSTTPTNPVFDGGKYYYLPWGNSKPYVRIDCEWEDVCFRLGALNKLLRMARKLEQRINELKSCASTQEKEQKILETVDALIDDCGSLPKLDPEKSKLTRLDQQMFEKRKAVLDSVEAECEKLKTNLDESCPIEILESLLKRIQLIAVEPQNSIPDIIIWMIKAERERVAYCRIPANELLFREDESERGEKCGKTIDVNLKFPGNEKSNHKSNFAAILRLMIWFGREVHQVEWKELEKTGGQLSLFAETYENQTCYGLKWSSSNLSRPAFSNSNGTLSLPKERFTAPEGWQFKGDWETYSELSTQFKDSGCKTFVEDVFENEYRYVPGGVWQENTSKKWTDRFGNLKLDNHKDPIKDKDQIQPKKGWKWVQRKWMTDEDRAVDSNGWEYTVDASYGSTDYEATEKKFHFCRRKRWIRERVVIDSAEDRRELKPVNQDGWEYALTFKSRFHAQEKPLYIVRRKRLRKMLIKEKSTSAGKSAADPVFILENKAKEKDGEPVLVAPSIFLSFKDPLICQLRAYIFQGRNLLPSDPDGLADPFVRLSFGIRSAKSKKIKKKLNPTWNQMLVLESVPIYGHPEQIIENPPDVVLELFDWDPVGKNEFLGRVQVEPKVLQDDSEEKTQLSWLGVYKGSSKCGDVLAGFELYLDEKHLAPLPVPDDSGLFSIPDGIKPETERKAVEVLCWGLRNLRRFRWMKVKSPRIEIEICNKIEKKSVSNDCNYNFEGDRVLCFDVNLPNDAIYLPAITIQLKSGSHQSPIGICVVKNLHEFQRKRDEQPLSMLFDEENPSEPTNLSSSPSDEDGTISITVDSGSDSNGEARKKAKASKKKEKKCDDMAWWSKYDAAKTGEENQLTIYPNTLEEEYDYFQDHIKTFYFRRGKMQSADEDDEDSIVGEFKGALAIYNLPDDYHEKSLRPRIFKEQKLQQMFPTRCIVRVYVVKAYDLKPKDSDGLSDPYLVVSLGNETFNNKNSHLEDTLEAEFGKVFEFDTIIPDAKDLKIKVFDYDIDNDDLIGETVVDLENRLLTKRHAIAGLPPTYNISGPNKWRLGSKYTPSVILKNYCDDFGITHRFSNSDNSILTLSCGREERYFKLDQFENSKTDLTHAGENMERLSLHVLNSLKENYSMVPEHIETRDLTNDLFPGFSQGKLEMFVHIFPERYGRPGPPIDISPPKPKRYELRVIVWNTNDVQLQETNIYGDEMSDIFVKCRMTGIEDVQKTDTHFRSLNGDGMFNYRMVFPFEYSETKRKVIVMKKAHFLSRRKYAEEVQPLLIIEIWDNDLLSFDDFIGDVKLDLQNLPKPYRNAKDITDWPLSEKTNSLFDKRRVKGWWPVAGKPKENGREKKKGKDKEKAKSNQLVLTGKIELTLELLEEEDAKASPVGKGQSEPNRNPMLTKPRRPETSFLWILNPWKSFRYVIWHHFKWYFVGGIILILIVLLFALFIYSAPGYSVKKLFNT